MDREKLKNMLLENSKIQKLASSNKPNMPNAFQIAGNLASTAVNVVKSTLEGNPLNVETDEADRRKNICNSCEFFNKAQERCSKCGCFMAVKAYIKAASCPVGKW
jgi:uncharacterized paraquat-inducible protein A